MIIKSLDSDSSLAHWIFMPHTSTSLIHTLKEEKTNELNDTIKKEEPESKDDKTESETETESESKDENSDKKENREPDGSEI